MTPDLRKWSLKRQQPNFFLCNAPKTTVILRLALAPLNREMHNLCLTWPVLKGIFSSGGCFFFLSKVLNVKQ